MSKSNIKKSQKIKHNDKRKNILDLSDSEACDFFMEHENYCNLALPPYIRFEKMLKNIHSVLKNKNLSDFQSQSHKPKEEDKVNYTIIHNKDGKYAWRPIQLIHPALYMSLVHNITKKEHWDDIRQKFKEFKENSRIKCMSIPVVPSKSKKTKAEQILNWWNQVEQQSITMSLDYEYLTQIDISNCYGSIYTHSISWALHDKDEIKKDCNSNSKKDCNRNSNSNSNSKILIGNIIDKHLRDMLYGQTNGIPQGSVLMDFIAEMVLGHIDCELTKKIKDNNIKNYDIIRYRDDYRIFTNRLIDGEKIVKIISEILIDFRMSLNPNKTKTTNQVIRGSIKPDKLYWMQQKQSMSSLQKHLMLIHSLSIKFPNSGSLTTALTKFYDTIKKRKTIQYVHQLISIIVGIAYHNPKTYYISAPIISQLIKYTKKVERKNIIEKIKTKFKTIPNTGHLDIWLQRMAIGCDENISFDEPICKIVADKNNESIWNSNWLKKPFKSKINDKLIVDEAKLEALRSKPIERKEFEIFLKSYY